jgi:transcription-repair coupling factor (superfamily II helicase)
LLLERAGIEVLTAGSERFSLTPAAKNNLDPSKMIALVSSKKSGVTLTPESKIVCGWDGSTPEGLFRVLQGLVGKLELQSGPQVIP